MEGKKEIIYFGVIWVWGGDLVGLTEMVDSRGCVGRGERVGKVKNL